MSEDGTRDISVFELPHRAMAFFEGNMQIEGSRRYANSLAGDLIAYPRILVDLDGTEEVFFIFPKLCIRSEGKYRLKFTLFNYSLSQYCLASVISSYAIEITHHDYFEGLEPNPQLVTHFMEQGVFDLTRRKAKESNGSF